MVFGGRLREVVFALELWWERIRASNQMFCERFSPG
jgi:hypothetical protein